MLFSQAIVSVLSVLTGLACANPSPAARVALQSRQTTNSSSPEQLLAMNIGIDMMVQQGEIAAVQALQQMQQAGLADPDMFNATKVQYSRALLSCADENQGTLMSLVSAASSIRFNSQKLAPTDNAALPGLAQLEESQVMGFIAANNLTGDPSADGPNLDSLLQRFQGDLAKNKDLQAKVRITAHSLLQWTKLQQATQASGAASASGTVTMAPSATSSTPVMQSV